MAKGGASLVQLLQNVGTTSVKVVALFGEPQTVGRAEKEGAFQILFQRANDIAQTLLGYVEPFGCVRQIKILTYFAKIINFLNGHSCHLSLYLNGIYVRRVGARKS